MLRPLAPSTNRALSTIVALKSGSQCEHDRSDEILPTNSGNLCPRNSLRQEQRIKPLFSAFSPRWEQMLPTGLVELPAASKPTRLLPALARPKDNSGPHVWCALVPFARLAQQDYPLRLHGLSF